MAKTRAANFNRFHTHGHIQTKTKAAGGYECEGNEERASECVVLSGNGKCKDERTDGRTDGTDGWMNGRMERKKKKMMMMKSLY